MSEKNQRIFKWLVWISLIIILGVSCFRWGNSMLNPDITKTEWMKLLASKIDREYLDGYGNEAVTGRDIAISSMKALGDKRLDYLIEGEITDKSLIVLAEEIGIVEKKDLNDTYNEIEANEVLFKLLAYYSDPETYPVYDKTQYSEGVVDTRGYEIVQTSDDSDIVTITTNGEEIKEDEILLIENEYGISEARKVVLCEKGSEDNQYSVTLENITSVTDVVTQVSFSGYADFSYLDNYKVDNSESENITGYNSSNRDWSANWFSMEPEIVYAADEKETKSKVDLEFAIAYNRAIKNNKPADTTEFTIMMDGVELDVEFPVDPSVEDEVGINDTKEMSIEGTVSIKDLSVLTSADWNLLNYMDKNNAVAVTLNGNVELAVKVTGEYTGEIMFPEIPLPINVGPDGSIFSVKLQPILMVGVGGEVSLEWRVNSFSKGFEYVPSKSKPLIWISEMSEPIVNFNTSVYLESGLKAECKVSFLGIELADPGVEIKTLLNAETQLVKRGFEEYPACVDIGAFFPLIKIFASEEITNEEDASVLSKVLEELEITVSVYIFTEENAPVKINQHMEFEKDGTMKDPIEGVAEDVCTHVIIEEEDDMGDIEESIDDFEDEMLEDAKRKFLKELEAEITKFLNKLLMESCGC